MSIGCPNQLMSNCFLRLPINLCNRNHIYATDGAIFEFAQVRKRARLPYDSTQALAKSKASFLNSRFNLAKTLALAPLSMQAIVATCKFKLALSSASFAGFVLVSKWA